MSLSIRNRECLKIIFDICLGRFSILAQRETVQHSFKVNRVAPGEVILDLPYLSLTFTNHQKAKEP